MPRIPDEWIERVKEVSLVLLAERSGVELKPVGEELVARCPFPPHEDSTPSLSINPAKNVFQCFGCGVGGTSIDWVKHERNFEFREAVEWLLREFFPSAASELLGERRVPKSAEEASDASAGAAPEAGAARRLSRRSRAPVLPSPFERDADDQMILNQYADLCHSLFGASAEAQDCVRRRGIDDAELVSRFRLGYQDRTLGLRLPTAETKEGREARERFQKLGLIRDSGHGHFVGSLVIPTIDLSGNVTGLYGRKTRNDLRLGTPDHLYLPGPDRDVFNEEAFVAGAPGLMGDGAKEIVLCEARIDALSFWRWGIRNVTACRGVHLSEALFDAFVSYGVERCFIAFDRDEAGDRGAEKVAAKLMPAGVACLRVQFPKGMDANEVALKMTPADKTLALFLRSAEWMGNGNGNGNGNGRHSVIAAHVPSMPVTPATVRAEEPPPSAAEATEDGEPGATEEEKGDEPSEPVKPSDPAGPCAGPPEPTLQKTLGLLKLTDDEAELLLEDRRYRVRGLRKCMAYGSLRINLKAEREGILFETPSPIAGWHMDNIDLCVHRPRQAFERIASHELGVREELIRSDLGKLVKLLEAVQEQRIAESCVPKVKVVKLSEKETEEAIAFWKSADLFTRIADDYTRCGLVGELTNKIATYIGSTSRLLERPLAIIIQSSSAAGKSTLMEKTLAFMPEEMKEKYTAVSGKSLFYLDENTVLSHKILAIVEEEGAEKATYPLKILNSEGELVMASTGKDPHTGKLVTKIYRVQGPVMIILTTTAVEIDPELENRCLRLTVDESREQTRAIHELQRMRMTHEGHVLQAERERIEKVHQNAQRLLRRLHVHNPYARHLTFVSDQTRTRRDHDKYLALIETIALMHQFQRPVYRRQVNGTSEEYVDVTIGDLELAGRLVGEILGQLLHDLSPQTQVFLAVLDETVTKLCEESGVDRSELRFTRKQIRELTGWRNTQVHIHISRLIELEYVLAHRSPRGNGYVYELFYAGEGRDGKPFVLGLVDVERLRAEEAEASTTGEIRGESPRYSGVIRAAFGPDSGGIRTPESGSRPAPAAALRDPEPKSAENALIPPARKTRSYTLKPVVPGQDEGNGNGHRTLRLLRFNLLRRPAITLSRGSTRSARVRPGPDASLPAGA